MGIAGWAEIAMIEMTLCTVINLAFATWHMVCSSSVSHPLHFIKITKHTRIFFHPLEASSFWLSCTKYCGRNLTARYYRCYNVIDEVTICEVIQTLAAPYRMSILLLLLLWLLFFFLLLLNTFLVALEG